MKSSTLEHTTDSDLDSLTGLPAPPPTGKRMYALSLDLDHDALRRVYPGSAHNKAYFEIRNSSLMKAFRGCEAVCISEASASTR